LAKIEEEEGVRWLQDHLYRCYSSDWGSDAIMTEAERLGIDYLLKLRQSANVKKLILQKHGASGWQNRIGIMKPSFPGLCYCMGWANHADQKTLAITGTHGRTYYCAGGL
jgi:hypothetical protein